MLKKFFLLFCSALAALTLAASENLVKNPNFKKLRPWQDWRGHYDAKVSHTQDGSGSWCFDYPDSSKPGHIFQKVAVNQKFAAPILVSAWCKAEIPDSWGEDLLNFSLRTCVIFNDGSKTWRYNRPFAAGKKEWQKQEMLIDTGKPVKEILLYGRFANHKGKVWFDDFTVKALGRKALPPCRAEKTSLPGKCEGIRISNGFVSLELEPGRGGSCVEFKDLLRNKVCGASGNFRFLGGDRMLKFNYSKTLTFPFRMELRKNSDEMLQLALTKDDFPDESFWKFTRVYTLKRNSAEVKIDDHWHNRHESMASKVTAAHFRCAPTGRDAESVFIIPGSSGSKTFPARSGGDTFISEIVRPFAAVLQKDNTGTVWEFDPAAIAQLYMWRAGVNASTLELFYTPVKADPGKELVRSVSFYPFGGLSRIDGAANGIAVQLEKEKTVLYASSETAGEVEVSLLLPGGKEKMLLKQLLLLDAGEKTSLKLPACNEPAALALKVTVKRNGKLFFAAERPLSEQYKLKAQKKKIAKAENPEVSHTLSLQVKTPAIPWAKNWHKGKIRALFIINSPHGRELVELAQRMDIDLHTFWFSHFSGQMKWGRAAMFGTYSYEDANSELARLLKAQKYDVIVAAGRVLKNISAVNAAAVADKVRSGTNLLLINPWGIPAALQKIVPAKTDAREYPFSSWRKSNEHQLLSGTVPELLQPGEYMNISVRNAVTLLKTEKGAPLLQLFSAGQGKCAVFAAGSGGGLLPFLPRHIMLPEHDFYEYQFVPLIKVLLHLSGKLPASGAGVKIAGNILTFTGGDSIEIHYRNLTANSSRVSRHRAGEKITLSMAPGVNAFNCIIRKAGKTVWFGSSAVTVAPVAKIDRIVLQKDFFRPGELIRGEVRFSGKPSDTVVTLEDSYGRVISQTGGKNFTLPVTEAGSRRMYVRVRLYSGKVLQSSARVPVAVKVDRQMAAYEIIGTADSGENKLNRAFDTRRWQLLRELFGVKVVRYWGAGNQTLYEEQLRHGFAADFPMIPGQRLRDFFKKFSEPYARTGDKKYLHRDPCFHDAKHLDNIVKIMHSRFAKLDRFSPVSYDFDDESSLSKWGNAYDFCFGPHSLQAFREYLQKRYKSLKELNTSWGTSFAAWDQVAPMTTPEITGFAAKSRNFAAWAEFRDFMDASYAAWHGKIAAEARKYGQKVPFDISGTSAGNAYNGLNWYRWAPFIDQASLYHMSEQEELMRSFAKKGFRATPWFGYGGGGKTMEYRIWLDALMFKRGGASYYSVWSMLRPDYTLDAPARDFRNFTMDLRKGVGEILNMSRSGEPDVLIHYSQPGIYAYEAEKRLAEMIGTRVGWHRLLTDSGLSFKYIAYADIEKGALLKQKCRTLILPGSIAMSAAEAAEIRKFIKAGGKVISSGKPGIMNENSTLLKKGLLENAGVIEVENPGNYPYSERTAAHRKGISRYLPAPSVKFSGDCSRNRIFAGELPGGGKIFGVIREADADAPGVLTLKVPEERYWYDLRKGRFLGKSREQKFRLLPARAEVAAAFKSKLPVPEISIKNTGDEFRWTAKLPGCNESTLFQVEIFRPDGSLYELYSTLAPKTAAETAGKFRRALNDPAGTWTIRCTDKISSLQAQKKFYVSPK